MIDPAQIREHMPVVDTAGFPVGTVVGVDGEVIRLTRAGAADGARYSLALARIDRLADGRLWLRSALSDGGTRLSPEALAAGYHGQGGATNTPTAPRAGEG